MRADPSPFVRRYDQMILDPDVTRHYRDSGFFNVGYWAPGVQDQVEACERLVHELLLTFPNHAGRVLDLACGLGATTNYLTRYYRPSDVVGVNLSTRQLDHCREQLPACTFHQMDAAALDFPDGSFDRILCVEAAFHFQTRADFLREAYRVLRPGGWITVSDILVDDAEAFGWDIPEDNQIETTEAYGKLWDQTGFQRLRLVDATELCWNRYCDFMIEDWKDRMERGHDSASGNGAIAYFDVLRERAIRHYLLVTATKPA